jgi:hypothetical protein
MKTSILNFDNHSESYVKAMWAMYNLQVNLENLRILTGK